MPVFPYANDILAVALDPQARRLPVYDGEEDQIRKLSLDPLRPELIDARQLLRAGIKPQPRVQEVTLLDRFDDRRVGAFEIHG